MSPAGRFVGAVTRLEKFWLLQCGFFCRLEAERQTALQRRGVAFGNELVLRGTAFLLGALRGKQVTEAGRATDKLALGGQLEALGDGLFGLLHEKNGRKQGAHTGLARFVFKNLAVASRNAQKIWLPSPVRPGSIQPFSTTPASNHGETGGTKTMSTTQHILNVAPRAQTGRSASRRVRKANQIPAILYGKHTKPETLAVDAPEFAKLLKAVAGRSLIIELHRKDKATDNKALSFLQEVQRDPITDRFLHVDLQEVKADEKMDINVPVSLVGESFGVKNQNGVLDINAHTLRIRCLPKDLPPHIEVDVTELKAGESIKVGSIKAPAGVELRDLPGHPIVSCQIVEEEAVATPAAGAAAPAAGAAAPAAGAAAPAAGAKPAAAAAPAAGAKPAAAPAAAKPAAKK